MAGESTITVPASFVNLLRETVVTQLVDCAIEISDSGRAHPEGLEECLLEPFERYCALLRCVGCLRTVPALAVRIALPEHRWALVVALRRGLDFEQWMAEQGDPADPQGATPQSAAQGTPDRAVPCRRRAGGLRPEREGDARPPRRAPAHARGVRAALRPSSDRRRGLR
jgi:hypothetical protein